MKECDGCSEIPLLADNGVVGGDDRDDPLCSPYQGGDVTSAWLVNSLLFNAVRVSVLPSIKGIGDNIWAEVNEGLPANKPRSNRRALAVVLANLLLAYWQDRPVAYSRRRGDYSPGKMYRLLFISFSRTMRVIDSLTRHGYVNQAKGYYDREHGGGRNSRMWASPSLVTLFDMHIGTIRANAFVKNAHELLIRLKDDDKNLVNYIPTRSTERMKKVVGLYNEMIAQSRVTVTGNGDVELTVEHLVEVFEAAAAGRITLNDIHLSTRTCRQAIRDRPEEDERHAEPVYKHIQDYLPVHRHNIQVGGNTILGSHRYRFIDNYIYDNTISYITGTNVLLRADVPSFRHADFSELPRCDFFHSRGMNHEDKCLGVLQKLTFINRAKPSLNRGEAYTLRELGIESLSFEIQQKDLHRVFSRASWKKGGRFYGGYYQVMPKILRGCITIDGNQAIELDYAAHHIRIPYHLNGIDYLDDPYLALTDNLRERKLFKLVALIAINSRDERKAILAVRHRAIEAGLVSYAMPDIEIKQMLERFRQVHSPIAAYIHSDKGVELQYIDSRITEAILMQLMTEGIPCLPVHDSYIVPQQHRDRLREVMILAYRKELGFSPVIG
jgi:hypothetical protein